MTEQHKLSFHPVMLGKRVLLGAGIAFALIAGFLGFCFTISDGNFDLGLWVALPLLTVTITGALGGAGHYVLDLLLHPVGWVRMICNILFALAYLVALWLSLIIALSMLGMWD